jgi:hypothetical protein
MICWFEKEIRRPAGYLDGVLDGNSGERVHPGDLVLQVIVVGGAEGRRRRGPVRRQHGTTEGVVLVGQRVRDAHANQSSKSGLDGQISAGNRRRRKQKRRCLWNDSQPSSFVWLRFFY